MLSEVKCKTHINYDRQSKSQLAPSVYTVNSDRVAPPVDSLLRLMMETRFRI